MKIIGQILRWMIFLPVSILGIIAILYVLQFAEILLLAFQSIIWMLIWLAILGGIVLSVMKLISVGVTALIVYLCPNRIYGGYIFITFSVIAILLGVINMWISQEKYDIKSIIICLSMTFICIALLQSILGGVMFANRKELESEQQI